MIIPDMEGMGSAVDIHEVIAGNEGEQYRTLTSDDYWQRFRGLLTQEVNAAIAGARSGGAGRSSSTRVTAATCSPTSCPGISTPPRS